MVSCAQPPAGAKPPHRQIVRDCLLLLSATLACLLPFLGKAIHIDDYLFVRMARQILANPADPFGTTANWNGSLSPLHDICQNPPGAAYFLALVANTLGWSENALHAGFLLPAVAATYGPLPLDLGPSRSAHFNLSPVRRSPDAEPLSAPTDQTRTSQESRDRSQ